MLHRTHLPNALLAEGASASDATDALLHDLGQSRARKRPRGRPFVTLAYAQSVDGSISIARGQRSALSGPDAMRFTHALRAGHDGILVGVGTVLADDPELRVRLVDGPNPQPVIVDSHLSTPVAARLLAQAGRNPWIGTTTTPRAHAHTHASTSADAQGLSAGQPRAGDAGHRRAGIEARGARILACDAQPNGWVDLSALLRRLHAEGIEHLMVEGGARIITSFLEAGLVDYVTVTIAPMFMGGLSAVGRLTRPLSTAPASAPESESASSSTLASPSAPPLVGPVLTRWVSARLGHDLVISGEVSWPAG